LFGSSCYKLKSETTKSWLAARYDCLREGGDLLSLATAAEEEFVLGQLDQSHIDLWLGFSTLVRRDNELKHYKSEYFFFSILTFLVFLAVL